MVPDAALMAIVVPVIVPLDWVILPDVELMLTVVAVIVPLTLMLPAELTENVLLLPTAEGVTVRVPVLVF
jgi:hypothetical protein